jgi:hypothetical protein
MLSLRATAHGVKINEDHSQMANLPLQATDPRGLRTLMIAAGKLS